MSNSDNEDLGKKIMLHLKAYIDQRLDNHQFSMTCLDSDAQYKIGSDLAQHIKQYVGTEISSFLNPIIDDSNNSDDEVTPSYLAAERFYLDPLLVNNSPLSLPLPELWQRMIALKEQHEQSDFVIIVVSAASWEKLYARLLTASQTYPEFLETAVNVRERFHLIETPSKNYTPTITAIIDGDASGIVDWRNQHDQILSVALILQYDKGQVPSIFL